MNQLISEFLKSRLPKRRKEQDLEPRFEHDVPDTRITSSQPLEGDLDRSGLRNTGVLNDIQEEDTSSNVTEEKTNVVKRDKKGVSDRKSSILKVSGLKHRVSSLPDLRLRAFSQQKSREEITTEKNTLNDGRSGERSVSSQSCEPSVKSLSSSARRSAKLRSWLHLTPSSKPDTEAPILETGGRILRQQVHIASVCSSPDAGSLSSGPVSGSRSRSRSSTTSRRQSKEIMRLSSVCRSKSSESDNARNSQVRKSTSSFTESQKRNSVNTMNTEKPVAGCSTDLSSSQINVRRRRSRTVGTIDHHQQGLHYVKPAGLGSVNTLTSVQNAAARDRSNSSGSISNSGPNGFPSNQRNFSNLASRRSNSLVTTLTNIISLRSMSALHFQKPQLPTPIPFDALESPPKPLDSEDEEQYLYRILPTYQKYLALILCAHQNTFKLSCLQLFIDKEFNFTGQPLDFSLRTVLLFLDLPKEGQQIDRFLKCFSVSYYKHNSKIEDEQKLSVTIWKDTEQVFFLTYSLLMLHTDYFNPNNKEKMTKPEFVKLIHSDTDSSGKLIPREYIEYLYDNITAKEFPSTVLPPYENEDNSDPQEFVVNTFLEQYSPVRILQSQWLSQRPFLIIGKGTTGNTLQFPSTPPAVGTANISSSASSSLSIFTVEDLDPYHYIINDTLSTVTLRNFMDKIPDKALTKSSEIDLIGVKKLIALLKEIKGGYLKLNRAQLSDKFKEPGLEFLNKSGAFETVYMKVLKMGEIEMKVSTRKFSLVGSSVRSQWKTRFAILTASFMLFFDSMEALDTKIELDTETGTSNYIIDLSDTLCQPYEIENCNNMFLTGAGITDSRVLNMISHNRKREVMFRSKEEASAWKTSVYFAGSIDGCIMDIGGLQNTVISERKVSVEDKLSRLKVNHEQNMSKWNSLYMQLNSYLDTIPLVVKTRSALLDHVNGLIERMEMVSHQNERLDMYIKILQYTESLEPNFDNYIAVDVTSIDESFLFSQQSMKSFDPLSVSE